MNSVQNNAINKTSGKIVIKDIVLIGMFTALICVMAQLIIPIQPIPFTLSLVSLFLAGALLSPRNALLAALAYLLLGTFGLPVFANMQAGPQYLTGMTGGYLMAYPLMSFLPALGYKYVKKNKVIGLTLGMVISLLLCYFFGTLWFTFVSGTGFNDALILCVYPYVPFDLVKIAVSVVLGVSLRKTALKQFFVS